MNTFLDATSFWLHSVLMLSWKGALLALGVGLIVAVLRRQLSPAWRHGLWLLVLVRLAVPDVATSSWSMSRWLAMPNSVKPISQPMLPLPLSETTNEPEPMDSAFQLEMQQAAATPEQAPASLPKAMPPVWSTWQWLTLVWLLGMGGVLGLMIVLHLRMRQRVLRDQSEPSAATQSALLAACEQAGISRAPRLLLTDAVRAPALFGIVRPVILLPRELEVLRDSASLNLIFLHELAHLQRRDLWAQVIASLIIAVHWFNPIVWWAGRRLRAEAEMAADAHALRRTEASEAHRLGEVLLGFANRAASGWMVWFAAATVLGISENKRDLRHRIEALMDLARGRRTWWMIGLTAFVGLSVMGLTQAPAEETKKVEAKTTMITGIVVDETGKPISGADCLLLIGELKDIKQQKTTSDEKGIFRFEAVPESPKLSLSARHEAHLDAPSALLKFSSKDSGERRLILPTARTWLSGKVTRKSDGAPVPEAKIYLGKEMKSTVLSFMPIFMQTARRKVKTDASGNYRVAHWSEDPESLMLVIDAPGMALSIERFNWDDKDIKLEHQIEAAEEVSGKVVNAEGQPVNNATVTLQQRFYFMNGRLMQTSPDDLPRYNLGHWIGSPSTDSKGDFRGKVLDRSLLDKLWLVVHHPTEGYQQVQLRDWKPGSTLKLTRWSSIEGQLFDAEGKPLPDTEIKFHLSKYERDANGQILFSVSKPTSCITDKQGHYKVDQMLSETPPTFASVLGKSIGMSVGPLPAGETVKAILRLPATESSAPANQLRSVTGHLLPPANQPIRSDQYKIRVNIGRVGNVGANALEEASPEGRFISRPLPPGDYTLRVWVEPKDRTFASDFNRGFSLPFKLEAASQGESLDLGEFKLEPADFVLRPAQATSIASKTRKTQRLNAPVKEASSFATWTSSGGSGTAQEEELSPEGKITGNAVISSNQRFILRATKPDGTRHYSAVQIANDDPDQAFEKELSFTPGVTVEGQMRDLPNDGPTQGWVVAAVRVRAPSEQGKVILGSIPELTWHAWAPVQQDGKFRFPSLPRGSLSLIGFGQGWTTRDRNGLGCEVWANLMGSESLIQVTADTKPCLQKRVQLLHADGTVAAGATISFSSISTAGLNRAWGRWGHAFEAADEEAYRRYKKEAIPGHSAKADAEGHATLSNQLFQPYGQTTCEVKWIDPVSQKEHREKVDLKLNSNEIQVVTLKQQGS